MQLAPARIGRDAAAVAPGLIEAAETDSQGNFTFDDVVPGSYILGAERRGYTNARYATSSGTVLTVATGDHVTGISIQMTPQGIIAGKIFDDEDQPLPDAIVNIRLLKSFPDGRQFPLVPGLDRTTDADGAFAIGGLMPGKYVLSVSAPPNTGPPAKSSAASRQGVYVRTYYPNGTDPGAATPVELTAGEQVRGLEIRLQKIPVFKVSGKVVDAATGGPASVDSISLIRRGTGAPPGLSSRSVGLKAGEFSFDEVLAGDYALETKPKLASSDGPPIVGWQVISVGHAHLDRVIVEMKPGIEVSGKVIVEGAPPTSWPQITLTPTEGLNYPDFAPVANDGRFTLGGLEPASYQVNISGVSRPAFVKAIRFNGSDLISSGTVDLTSASSASMEIVISDRATASISGVVTDSGAQPQSGAIVLAIPRQQQTPAAPFRMPLTDVEGRYSIQGLVPGDYILAAIQAGQMLAPPPPDALEKLGKMVTLAEDKTVTVDLQLVTMDELRALVPH